jgi:hypothetical protein
MKGCGSIFSLAMICAITQQCLESHRAAGLRHLRAI